MSSLPDDTKLYYKIIKPILFGKILFAPNTSQVRRVISKANSTFAKFELYRNLFADLVRVLNQTESQLSQFLSILDSKNQWITELKPFLQVIILKYPQYLKNFSKFF